MSAPFIAEKRIRFHHCDPAGIVFFPQYFVLFQETIEDWFTEGLGDGFIDRLVTEKVSTPLAQVNCSFIAPSRIGDALEVALSVSRVGRTSVSLQIRLSCQGEARIKADIVAVNASMETLRPEPWSEDLKARMAAYQEA
jgi:4-hydroxybenzoyl-CoA thioesterase